MSQGAPEPRSKAKSARRRGNCRLSLAPSGQECRGFLFRLIYGLSGGQENLRPPEIIALCRRFGAVSIPEHLQTACMIAYWKRGRAPFLPTWFQWQLDRSVGDGWRAA